ncbi:Phosphate regulon sensor protein PhoR (SphS) [Richelia intracellularis HH01]|uniref:histidine kinase n=1 Tax=Richelia intracellularis HH01 TaxID=1165094 RepID=M1X2H0_9NOST|nr:HAMP domain-containing sensor histidine kinase [Richelia intracellularis]CCH66810.1 Phosphate regulon sensor protein PhoR (SphS) [Richelia intracellularis HH01]HAE06299.1 sensor histidine kinase [Richelia sp.]
MQLILFLTGLAIGLGLWMWQKFCTEYFFGKMPQDISHGYSKSDLPIIPQLQGHIELLEQEKLELHAKLRDQQELLDLAPTAFLHVNRDNQLKWCNQQARQLLSLQRWQPGQVKLLLKKLVNSYELDQLIEQTRSYQQPQVSEWVYYPSLDCALTISKVKSLLVRASSFPLANGEVVVFIENRQSLLDISKERDRVFSDLAHELRTPLTSIRLVVETLQNRLESPLSGLVNRLLREVDRLIHLVQRCLDLSQLETKPSMDLNCQPIELRSLVLEVWETLEAIAQGRHIQISETGGDNMLIHADKSRMYQVFLNLLDNAIKYSPDGGTIKLKTETIITDEGRWLSINIIDAGRGFAETDLPNVFDRFFRGDQSRIRYCSEDETRVELIEGSGLGLAIVQQIIMAHGGSIKALNDTHTGGARLQLILPARIANPET